MGEVAPELYTQDGTVDMKGNPALKENTGNSRACPYILANEFCVRLAYYGMSTNLVNFMKDRMGMANAVVANNVTNWSGTCYIHGNGNGIPPPAYSLHTVPHRSNAPSSAPASPRAASRTILGGLAAAAPASAACFNMSWRTLSSNDTAGGDNNRASSTIGGTGRVMPLHGTATSRQPTGLNELVARATIECGHGTCTPEPAATRLLSLPGRKTSARLGKSDKWDQHPAQFILHRGNLC